MPDDTQTGGQAPTGAQGQAPNAADPNTISQQPQTGMHSQQSTSQAGGSGNDTGTAAKPSAQPSMTLEEALAALERKDRDLADTRKEAATYRTKAKDLDKLREEAENAKLDDVQKAQKRAEAAEAAVKSSQARIAKAELRVAAKDAGIIDPDDAVAHLLAKIEFDEGEPRNVADLVKDLKASKPHLFASAHSAGQSPSGSQQTPRASAGAPASPARSSTQTGGLTRELIERMTPREYALRRADVMAWLAANPTR